MIVDGHDVKTQSVLDVDLCIIGAGPAGITIAQKFLNSAFLVALIESGGMEWREETQQLADGEVEGPPYFPILESRIRAFGGTTRSWAGVCAPFSKIDFLTRSWVPESGWPIRYEDLKPYYQSAMDLLHAETQITDKQAMSLEFEGIERVRMASAGKTWFGENHIPVIEHAENLKVILNSSAMELESPHGSEQISTARVACIGGNRYRIRARVFVLATGAIENARLLLVSNRTHAAGVGNDHDLVGRFFMEHPRIVNHFRLPGDIESLLPLLATVPGPPSFSRVQLSDSVQKREGLLNFQASMSFGYKGQLSEQWGALRRIGYTALKPWRNFPYHLDRSGGRNKLRWTDVLTVLKRPDRTILSALGYLFQLPPLRCWLEVESTVEQPPAHHNRVVLSQKTDRFGTPLPKLIWSFSPEEEHTYRRGLEIVLRNLEKLAPGISAGRIGDQNPWPERALGTWHHMGTTRMHEQPKYGVVNGNCRVHGINNLFVAGSSVFPTSGVHSPTLTIVALALRLADHLRDQALPLRT